MPVRPIASAFALAKKITGVTFSEDVLTKKFLVATANEE